MPNPNPHLALAAAAERRASAATPGVAYFVQSPDTGFDDYETLQEALDAAEETINNYRDEAYDGWSEEITSLRVGIVTHDVEMFDFKRKEDFGDDEIWPLPDLDEMCDYRMSGVDLMAMLAQSKQDNIALAAAVREQAATIAALQTKLTEARALGEAGYREGYIEHDNGCTQDRAALLIALSADWNNSETRAAAERLKGTV